MGIRLVITACVADLPPESGDPAHAGGGADPAPSSWSGEGLAARVETAVGAPLERRSMPPEEPVGAGASFKRRSSAWLCRSVERVLLESRLSGASRKVPIGLVNCLAYSYFSNDERVNLFQFKTNVEHQTPAAVGGHFGFWGPQFTVKEGDNADLVALDALARSFDCFPGPVVLCGISEPHPLLTSVELIGEQRRLARAAGASAQSGALPRFSEGAAALVLEPAGAPELRGCRPSLSVEATHGCMRRGDYADPAALRRCLARSLERLAGDGPPPAVVFGCFRNNRYLADAEAAVVRERYPEALLVNSSRRLQHCGVISGLVDVAAAVRLAQRAAANEPTRLESASGEERPVRLSPGDRVLVQKISRLGHYAGVMLHVH